MVTIASDPVEAPVLGFKDLEGQELGGAFDNFEKFWSLAKFLGRGAVAGAWSDEAVNRASSHVVKGESHPDVDST